MNIKIAEQLFLQLTEQGVRDFILCAGARNAPLVKVLNQATGIDVLSMYDERAAGFFALGRAQSSGRPVAVITTSGTAAAELLPSAVEAYYSGTPLVLITADRPKSFRGSGAPQAIEQENLFGVYAPEAYDYDWADVICDLQLHPSAPTHINVCFSEPLIDLEVPKLQAKDERAVEKPAPIAPEHFTFTNSPLVIVSGLPASNRGPVLEFILALQAQVVLECHSGLREHPALQSLVVTQNLKADEFKKYFDSVIRIGSVPTLRFWRDLEDKLIDVPVLSFSHLPFSGLARDTDDPLPLEALPAQGVQPRTKKVLPEPVDKVEKFLNSEPQWFRWLSRQIPQDAMVFLGNSLPIREWDEAADRKIPHPQIWANRGANGIDGLVAAFLGATRSEQEAWLILGDLSALYDLNSLSLANFAKAEKLRVVVINNQGGKIFERMFQDKNFVNSHAWEFEHWAKMFQWSYLKLTEQPGALNLSDRQVIEILPDSAATARYWVASDRGEA